MKYTDLTTVPTSVGFQVAQHISIISRIKDPVFLKEYINTNVFVDRIVTHGTSMPKMGLYRDLIKDMTTETQMLKFMWGIYWKAKKYHR